MKPFLIIFILGTTFIMALILSACAGQTVMPTIIPSAIPIFTRTSTLVPLPTAPPLPTSTLTPTSTPTLVRCSYLLGHLRLILPLESQPVVSHDTNHAGG